GGTRDAQVIEFSQVRDRFHPRLIRDVLAGVPPASQALQFGPHPLVKIELAAQPEMARVTVRDLGGGIGPVYLAVNGAVQMTKPARDCTPGTSTLVCSFQLDGIAPGRIKSAGNVVEAMASEASEQVLSPYSRAPWAPAPRSRSGTRVDPATANGPLTGK